MINVILLGQEKQQMSDESNCHLECRLMESNLEKTHKTVKMMKTIQNRENQTH